ncbi:MAG: histidine phosphatase family protein [Caldimonas sp.]
MSRALPRPARAIGVAWRSLALLFLLGTGSARADEAAAWAALRQGGVVALMRHGDAPGVGDPPGWRLDDCATQRNLSERGRADARAAGARLRDERIVIARVLSSPWCRCIDTATLVGAGAVQVEPSFANAFMLRERRETLREGGRAVIGRWRGPGVLLVVTHGENIHALTGVSPAAAEIVVVSAGADGTLRTIGSVPAPPQRRGPGRWRRRGARPPRRQPGCGPS